VSTRARILTTIGAAWVVTVLVASVALSTAPKRERYYRDVPGGDGGRYGRLIAWRDVYPITTWCAVFGIVTAAAVAGAIVATIWTRHD
jgi:hypothetical protein